LTRANTDLLKPPSGSCGESHIGDGFSFRYLSWGRFLIPEDLRVLELGCGIGKLLADLKPSFGFGVDFSPAIIGKAKQLHPDMHFILGDAENPDVIESLPGPFDVILIVDSIGAFDDIQVTFESLHRLCSREKRLIVTYYSHLWEPLVTLAEWIGWRAKQPQQNVLSPADIHSLAALSDFEVIKSESRRSVRFDYHSRTE
jgi:SAM-dependent methyltransferase